MGEIPRKNVAPLCFPGHVLDEGRRNYKSLIVIKAKSDLVLK